MRKKNLLFVLCLLLSFGLFTQCEKYGKSKTDLADEDSDRPEWAGGNTDSNPHINQNDDSGTKRGGDYGDLYELLRDLDGVPEMIEIGTEYYVQPVDVDGNTLELNAEGELVDPTQAIEVDFGRLNIVRSPESVLDQAFGEAMKVLAAPGATITLDFCGRLTSTYPDGSEIIVKTIDSPRENMALYKYIMTNLFEPLEDGNVNRLAFLGEDPYNFDPLLIAASCFAAGSDKTGTVDIDEVVYINGFMDCIGLNEVLNEHEYDFNHNPKYYFNFGEPIDGQSAFSYNRGDVYADRYIQFLAWGTTYYPVDEETGISGSPHIYSIKDVMEGLIPGLEGEKFTYMFKGEKTRVEGFAIAVDDAVQVLDYIHGDSNIRFLPETHPQHPDNI